MADNRTKIKEVNSFTEPASRRLLELAAKNNGFSLGFLPNYAMPREDFLFASEENPVFAVADGVTLELENYITFPAKSGAGEAAEIFCRTVVKEADSVYGNFSSPDLISVFEKGNEAVGEHNRKNNRAKEKSNFWDFDLFAATASFAVFRDGVVYWASICDSFVVKIGIDGAVVFKSPDCWSAGGRNLVRDMKNLPPAERKKILRRDYRNSIGQDGAPAGYGVVTGEQAACKYLNTRAMAISSGETLALITDGFEEYLKLPEFLSLVRNGGPDFQNKLAGMTKELSEKDPESFGHEKTLIAVRF